MKQHDYALFSGVIFTLIFLMHGVRLFLGWDVVVADVSIPMWVSWVAVIAGAFFAHTAFRLGGYIK